MPGMEEYAYVLDYLASGRPDDKSYHKSPIVLSIGEEEFKLLELVPKNNAVMSVGEKVYIGKSPELRTKILSVKRRISYRDLTHAAENELPFILESIINDRKSYFVDFFNNAQPINARMHSLELLPGLGNKTMWTIVEERKKRPFGSFEDLTERVKTLHNPQKMIAARIVEELSDRSQKHRLFVSQ
jgi:putative nucleotide binding protein